MILKPTGAGKIFLPHQDPELVPWCQNTVMYDWTSIVMRALQGRREYAIGGFYFEFENTETPLAATDVPSYGRAGGVTYYQGLATSDSRDFLRVRTNMVTEYNTDETKYSLCNKLRFMAITEGDAGVHGKEFSADANSIVIGLALVSMPEDDDPTQDLIYGRMYFSQEERIPKQDSVGIAVQYEISLV